MEEETPRKGLAPSGGYVLTQTRTLKYMTTQDDTLVRHGAIGTVIIMNLFLMVLGWKCKVVTE